MIASVGNGYVIKLKSSRYGNSLIRDIIRMTINKIRKKLTLLHKIQLKWLYSLINKG